MYYFRVILYNTESYTVVETKCSTGYMYCVGWAVNRLTVWRNRIVTVASERLTNPTLAGQ